MKKTIDYSQMWGRTMIHGHLFSLLPLLEKLYKELYLDIFDVTIRKPLTRCSSFKNGQTKVPDQIGVTFDGQIKKNELWRLWQALLKEGLVPVFKTNNMGYRINDYLVTDKSEFECWDLDDGGC